MRNCYNALKDGGTFICSGPSSERPFFFKMLRAKTAYRNAHSAKEWEGILKKAGEWKELHVETVQRIPIPFSLSKKCLFVKTGFGDPVIMWGNKVRRPDVSGSGTASGMVVTKIYLQT